MAYIKQWHENFRQIRLEKGLNQYEMAQLIGVSQALVTLWESCQRRFTEDMLLLIAEKCEVGLERLISVQATPNDSDIRRKRKSRKKSRN